MRTVVLVLEGPWDCTRILACVLFPINDTVSEFLLREMEFWLMAHGTFWQRWPGETVSLKKPASSVTYALLSDLHDTEDCPTQAQMSETRPLHTPRQSSRAGTPYCEICEMFGHWATNCNDDDDLLMVPSTRTGLSQILACRQLTTSTCGADLNSRYFDPINKSKKIFWSSTNRPLVSPYKFMLK